MSADWNAEVNAVPTEVRKTLERALAECDQWQDVIVVYGAPVDETNWRTGFTRDVDMTDERALWLLVKAQKLVVDDDGED